MTISINETVKIKPSEEGWRLIKSYYHNMGMPAKPKYTEDCFESKTDEQGWWECKLYEVMNIFGGTLKRGVKTPFYTEMKVPANKTKIDVNLKELLAKAQKEAEFWKGKYATVKLENNALRKKIYNINKGAGRVI